MHSRQQISLDNYQYTHASTCGADCYFLQYKHIQLSKNKTTSIIHELTSLEYHNNYKPLTLELSTTDTYKYPSLFTYRFVFNINVYCIIYMHTSLPCVILLYANKHIYVAIYKCLCVKYLFPEVYTNTQCIGHFVHVHVCMYYSSMQSCLH